MIRRTKEKKEKIVFTIVSTIVLMILLTNRFDVLTQTTKQHKKFVRQIKGVILNDFTIYYLTPSLVDYHVDSKGRE